MLKQIFGVFFMACSFTLYSCAGPAVKEDPASDKTDMVAATENKHTASLRDAVDKLIKAEAEKDSVTVATLLDSNNFSITARGQTFASREAFGNHIKTMQTEATSPVQSQNTYTVETVEAGSIDPVWAGYEKGMFTNTATSDDGNYNRKVSGPYYRAWKMVDGQWKCYHVVLMAFSCEGNDCLK